MAPSVPLQRQQKMWAPPTMFTQVVIKKAAAQKYQEKPERSWASTEALTHSRREEEIDLLLPSRASNRVPKQQRGQASATSFGCVNKEY